MTAASTRTTIRLSYDFGLPGQRGAEMSHPLFDALVALRDGGSIKQAAERLGRSYRHVWGLLRQWEEALGEPLVVWSQGEPARLSEFGQRLLWAELRARKRMQPHIDALRANLEKIVDDARDHHQLLLSVCASHDLTLPMLRDAAAAEALEVDLRFQGSIDAVRSLNAGRCLVAGFHVPVLHGAAPDFAQALKPLLLPGVHKLIAFCRRTQGLMMRREHAGQVQGPADLKRQPLRFVNRQIGSGTRLLMDHLLRENAIEPADIEGYDARIEESHVAVAANIASGVADVGPGVEAAALEFGLHFVPLAEEDYFLACLKPNLDHPAVLRLRQLLSGPGWQRAVAALPGYAPARMPGEVLPMATVLPWWDFDAPDRKGARRRHTAAKT